MANRVLSYDQVIELLRNEAHSTLKSLSRDRLNWKFKHWVKNNLGFQRSGNRYRSELGFVGSRLSDSVIKSAVNDLERGWRFNLETNRLSGA